VSPCGFVEVAVVEARTSPKTRLVSIARVRVSSCWTNVSTSSALFLVYDPDRVAHNQKYVCMYFEQHEPSVKKGPDMCFGITDRSR
jgi:hypothetical protein